MKNPFVLCAAAGGLLIVLGLWGGRSRPALNSSPVVGRALARADIVHAPVELRRANSSSKLDKRVALHRMDTISTGAGGEAVIAFENGEEIRLLENTRVTIDKEAGRPLIILKTGDFIPEKVLESEASARVLRDGERRRLGEDPGRAAPTTAGTPSKKRPIEPPQLAARKAPGGRLDRLTAEYIQDVLKSNRGLFFKCYTHLLQRSPASRGDATIALTIDGTGRIKNAEIASSQIPDPEFRDCLSTAAKRVEFKTFAGDPVQAIFPLRFE